MIELERSVNLVFLSAFEILFMYFDHVHFVSLSGYLSRPATEKKNTVSEQTNGLFVFLFLLTRTLL